ncbi:RNA recognition motif-containing protein [Toxoplasma gondii GAB2-2007-GAL-DOM2]|uniref:RNA recognition motif-containing protein n=7 Tax=Toxoplasma gondii TaxID=5811 RepID=S7V429_TOXGG|nr:RNA recognition motif-containing protein [Toxoplasma gondii GT1]KAF4642242.1 RNA recognition motif-containing protein [Toxoplasma gondii]KFG43589.1 RNA recognition motif-containing protein [Toxoplasma gondii GAB2-2007-GAL-DOM2]KFH05875.1 RNA recognition motif-containing protein [Toxoplasma gondii VAND]RQX75314.1 RNA recognition motif-containing protein [Toxoplasma gondii CAST]
MIGVSVAGVTSAEHGADPAEVEEVAGDEESFSHFGTSEQLNARDDLDAGLKEDDDVAYDEEELPPGLPLEHDLDSGEFARDEDRRGDELAEYSGEGEGPWDDLSRDDGAEEGREVVEGGEDVEEGDAVEGGEERREDFADDAGAAECADAGEEDYQQAEEGRTDEDGRENGGDGLGAAGKGEQAHEQQSEVPGHEQGEREEDRDGGDETAGKRKKRKKSGKKKFSFPPGVAAGGGPSRGPVVIKPPPPPPGTTGTPAPPPMPRVIHPKRPHHPPPPPSPRSGPPPPGGLQILTAPSARPSPGGARPPSGRAPFFSGSTGTSLTHASTPASCVSSHAGARSSPTPFTQHPPPPPPASASAPATLGASPSPSHVQQSNGPMRDPPPFPRGPPSGGRPGTSSLDIRAAGPAGMRGVGAHGAASAGGTPPPPPSGTVGSAGVASVPTIISPPHPVCPLQGRGSRAGGPIVLNPPVSSQDGSTLPPYLGEAHAAASVSPDLAGHAANPLAVGVGGRGPRVAAGPRPGFHRSHNEETVAAGYKGSGSAPPAGQPLPGRFGDVRMGGWPGKEPGVVPGMDGAPGGLEGPKGQPSGPFHASPASVYPSGRREEAHGGDRLPPYGYGHAHLDDSGQSAPASVSQRPGRRPVILSAGAGGRAGGPGGPQGWEAQALPPEQAPGYRGGQGSVPQEPGSGAFYESPQAYGFPNRVKRERELSSVPAVPPRFETGPGGRPPEEGGMDSGSPPAFHRAVPGHAGGSPAGTHGSDTGYGSGMGRSTGRGPRPDFASPTADIRDIRRRPEGGPLPGHHPVHSGALGLHSGVSGGSSFAGESGGGVHGGAPRGGGPWGGGSPRGSGPGMGPPDGRSQGFRRGPPSDDRSGYGGEAPSSGTGVGPWGGAPGGGPERSSDMAAGDSRGGFWSRSQLASSGQQSGGGLPFCGPESSGGRGLQVGGWRGLQGDDWRSETAAGRTAMGRASDAIPARAASNQQGGGSGVAWHQGSGDFLEHPNADGGSGAHSQRHLQLAGAHPSSQGERGLPGLAPESSRGQGTQAGFGVSCASPHAHAGSSAWQQQASRPPQSEEEAHFRHTGRSRAQAGQGFPQAGSGWSGGKEEASDFPSSWEPWQASHQAGAGGAEAPGGDQAWYENVEQPASAQKASGGHLGRGREVEEVPGPHSRRHKDGDRGQRGWDQSSPGYSAGRYYEAGERQSLRQPQNTKGSEREGGVWGQTGSSYVDPRDSSGRRGDGGNSTRGGGHGATRGTPHYGRDGEYGRPGGRGAEGHGGDSGLPGNSLRAHATPGPNAEQKGFTVIVTNVPVDLSAADLHQAFSAVGPLLRTDIMLSSSGERTGRVCFTFSTWQAAEDAVSRFDGGDLNGRCIRVFME